MAYTQSVLEQELAKKSSGQVGWPWKLLSFSFVVFITTLAIYIGMEYGLNQAYLSSRESSVDAKLKKLELTEDQKNNLVLYYSQVSNINDVLRTRATVSKYLDFIEKNTLKQITYDSIAFNTSQKGIELKLTGKTLSYSLISQQLEWFRNASGVKDAILDSSNVEPGNLVSFSIRLNF